MKRIITCFLVLWGMGIITACARENTVYLESDTQEEYDESASVTFACQPASCCVYICGAVVRPGVYEVPEGSRIFQVLELAGGFTEDAAVTELNQAEPVHDGQMLRVLTVEEAAAEAAEAQETADGRVNINTASVEELMGLAGIGESKAQSIVAYREEHGAFSETEELMNITGIKAGVYEKIKNNIKVD